MAIPKLTQKKTLPTRRIKPQEIVQEPLFRMLKMSFFVHLFLIGIVIVYSCFWPSPTSTADVVFNESRETASKLEILKTDLKDFSKRLDAVTKLPADNTLGQQIAQLKAVQETYSERLKIIEDSISTSPERVLSVPLLRKDLEELAHRMTTIETATHDDVERLYTFVFWFLTTVLSVAGAAIAYTIAQISKRQVKGKVQKNITSPEDEEFEPAEFEEQEDEADLRNQS